MLIREGRWKSRDAGEALASGWEAPAGERLGGRGAAGGWDGVKSGFIFPIRPSESALAVPRQTVGSLGAPRNAVVLPHRYVACGRGLRAGSGGGIGGTHAVEQRAWSRLLYGLHIPG
jgi:hypothetical protein